MLLRILVVSGCNTMLLKVRSLQRDSDGTPSFWVMWIRMDAPITSWELRKSLRKDRILQALSMLSVARMAASFAHILGWPKATYSAGP